MNKTIRMVSRVCILTIDKLNFNYAQAFPTACTVIAAPFFESCLDFQAEPDICGIPPSQYPCARVSYYVPSTFVEVVSGGKESFFMGIPPAAAQLAAHVDVLPFGAEDDNGSFSYQAHAITVPFVSIPFAPLHCGEIPIDRHCFGAMSEHIGVQWRNGSADALQPKFLAWSASPKACLLAGAATSLTGTFGAPSVDAKLCSFDKSFLTKFPPSAAPVCTGWGIHFPRTGTVPSSDQVTASLVIASRIKTLGSEVFQSVPSSLQEKWSMVYPSKSACFREGENIALLSLKNVNETGRITSGIPKSYLYASWQKVTCKRDWAEVPAMQAGIQLAKSICQGTL